MWPSIGPIRAYGALYLLGILLHFVLGRRIAKRYGLQRRVWIAASVCYMLGMTVGAKLLFDIRHHMLDLSRSVPGRALAAGRPVGRLAGVFRHWRSRPCCCSPGRRLAALDLVAVTIPIPWIAAKLGCFLNGCCYGKPCSLPWAVTFPQGSRRRTAGSPAPSEPVLRDRPHADPAAGLRATEVRPLARHPAAVVSHDLRPRPGRHRFPSRRHRRPSLSRPA